MLVIINQGFEKTCLAIIAVIILDLVYWLVKIAAKDHSKGAVNLKYVMKAPYFFCGQDLSNCPTKQAFIKLLSAKIKKQTGIKPVGLSAVAWNNSHAMYVIAQLAISAKSSSVAKETLDSIKKWFWDPNNQMLKFHLVK